MLSGMDIIFIGETLHSTYHNHLATNYRALIRELARGGHTVFFLEANQEVYRINRDLPNAPYCEHAKFRDLNMLNEQFIDAVRVADLIILGSGVPERAPIADWLLSTASGMLVYLDYQPYRLVSNLRQAGSPHDTMGMLAGFDLYLGAAGLTLLREIQAAVPCKRVEPFWGVVDQFLYYRTDMEKDYDLGFLGNYHPGKIDTLQSLLFDVARERPSRRYVVAGERYDQSLPEEVVSLTLNPYVPTPLHVQFFNRLNYSLHISHPLASTAGFTPPPLLLEAAACGVPIITRHWVGMEEFLIPYEEVFVAETAEDVSNILDSVSAKERRRRADRARSRVMSEHAPSRRAAQLLKFVSESDRANVAEV